MKNKIQEDSIQNKTKRINYGRLFRSFIAASTFLISAYLGNWIAIQIQQEKANNPKINTKQAITNIFTKDDTNSMDPVHIFTKLAKTYDRRIREPTIIQKRREMQINKANGDVLECGAGTCRNTKYYINSKVSSITYFDASCAMLYNGLCKGLSLQDINNNTSSNNNQSKQQLAILHSGNKPSEDTLYAAWTMNDNNTISTELPLQYTSWKNLLHKNEHDDNTTITISSIDTDIPQMYIVNDIAKQEELPDKIFDTVVDTYGLCTYKDPIKALKEMKRICKPEGCILLLEHGYSPIYFIPWIRQRAIKKHLQRWGCNHLQPIEQYIKMAGLNIKKFDVRIMFFFFFLIVLWLIYTYTHTSQRFGVLKSEYYIESSPSISD